MANRAITVMYEGVPNYPDFGRLGNRGQAQGEHFLYGTHRIARADEGGRHLAKRS